MDYKEFLEKTIKECKSKAKQFIHNEYIFWDEPNKYNIGDVLTLTIRK